MFYTKYRPQKFSELFGLETIAQALTSQLEKDQLGHAYLFCGPRGTGKTTTARILAKEADCRGLDLIEIDAASNRGIDDIRDLREKINLAPTQSGRKVYVVDEAHMLTREAFNALLKTLEEPPEHAIFILCTTEPHKVPETVRSRCQKFEFKRASTADIVKKLQFIAGQEKVEVSGEDLELIAKNAEGGFRDAETMLEQMIVGGLPAAEVVGLVAGESVGEFVELLLANQVGEAIKFINRMYEKNSNLLNFNQTLLEYLRSLLLIQSQVGEELLEAPEENYKQMKTHAGKLSPQKLDFMIKEFTQSAESTSTATIPQLPLEMAATRVVGALRPTLASTRDGLNSHSQDESPPSLNVPAAANNPDSQSQPRAASTVVSAGGGLRAKSNIVGNWNNVLQAIKPYNHSLEALLRSARPKGLEDGTLTLEVFYKFHKERLETVKNRHLLQKVLKELSGIPLKVRCVLGEKDNPKPPGRGQNVADIEEDALEVFNGKL